MDTTVNTRFSRKHPLISSIGVILVFILALNIPSFLLMQFGPSFFLTNGDFVFQGTVEAVGALVAIGMVFALKLGYIWKEKGTDMFSGFVSAGYFIIISLVSLVLTVSSLLSGPQIIPLAPKWKVVVFAVTVLLIGFTEEVFFRGIISNLFYEKHAKDSAGVWTATIYCGFVFGLMHLTNLAGSNPIGVLVQVFNACMMGMALTAVYYRCRNIWALVMVHALVNFCGAFAAGILEGGSLSDTISSYNLWQLLSALPYIAITFVLLRPSKMKKIIERQNLEYVVDETGSSVSSKSSKKSAVVSSILAVVISLVIIVSAIVLYAVTVITSFSVFGRWDGREKFSSVSETFTVDKADTYDIVMRNIFQSSDCGTVLTLYENDVDVFRCTMDGNVQYCAIYPFEEGSEYRFAVDYVSDDDTVPKQGSLYYVSIKLMDLDKYE